MLFEGSFRGDFDGRGGGYGGQLNFPILFDTGASSNFVNPTLLQKLGISYVPSSSTLRLADDSSAPILGKVRLRFKLQSFTSIVSCYVTDLCNEFDVILGNKFMISHRAVLDYSAYTVSLQRHGKRYTLIPRSILTNEGQLPDKVPEPEVRKSSSKSLPSKDKAARRANRADEHAKYTDCLNGLDPKLVLSCAQAKKSIQQGCRSFLVLVTQADVDKLKATLASATVSNAESGPTAAASNSPVNAPDLDPEQADLLQHVDALKQQYSDVFAEPSGLPPDRGVEHVIPLLPDSQPSFQRMYRLAPSELQEVQRQVIDLLSKQLIEPSTSPFGAPILFGAEYFSCLDAASGFHQVLLRDEDKTTTAFRTPFGHYQFRVLPFGLTDAPATFQAVMNNLFNPPTPSPGLGVCLDVKLARRHAFQRVLALWIHREIAKSAAAPGRAATFTSLSPPNASRSRLTAMGRDVMYSIIAHSQL